MSSTGWGVVGVAPPAAEQEPVRVAILGELRLDNFRGYRSLAVELGPGIFIVEGPNSSGKTNLVEAVYALGNGRSWRPGGHLAMVRRGEDGAFVAGSVVLTEASHPSYSGG